jgi:hypothetical protein
VILLENSNEWHLSPAKRRILKKRRKIKIKRSKDWKSKRGETSYEKLRVSKGEKKKRMKFASC